MSGYPIEVKSDPTGHTGSTTLPHFYRSCLGCPKMRLMLFGFVKAVLESRLISCASYAALWHLLCPLALVRLGNKSGPPLKWTCVASGDGL